MSKNLVSVLLASSILLSGCTGPGEFFEPTTYGVRDSVWRNMNESDRYAAQQSYIIDQQRRAEERRIQDMMRAKQAELNRVRDERDRLEREERDRRNRDSQEAFNRSFERDRQERARRDAEDNQRRLLQEAESSRRARERRQQDEYSAQANRRSQEQRDIEEAKRRSLITQREDEARRQQARAQEQRDIEEATRRSMETYNREQAARNSASATASTSSNSAWQPNEGQIVRAGELVMAQQRELGRQPSASEMQSRLQSSMGISSSQANKILDDLGLI